MKYYFRHSGFVFTEICTYNKNITIGSFSCTECKNIINKNYEENYIECKYLNLLDRTKKLKSI
ncbi:hypothetical protein M0Q50_02525 [bacterium]|nr:hypothetical protein [bacterium]